MYKIIGIEGTAWNFSVYIIDQNGQIIFKYEKPYKSDGGIIPSEVYRAHFTSLKNMLDLVLKHKKDVKYIVYSKGPGYTRNLRL